MDRKVGSPFSAISSRAHLAKNQIRLAQSAMANRDTHVAQLCEELNISRATLYRYVGPDGALRSHALKVLEA